MKPSRIAFTCGDPAGVGPEIVAGWLAANPEEAANVDVHGPALWLAGLPGAGRFRAVAAGPDDFELTPGNPSVAGAALAGLALNTAAADVRAGLCEAVVTGPVAKSWMARAGWPHPGQTEFFASAWGGEPVMAFCGGRLRVVLLTWHIPFAAVPGHLSPAAFARAAAAATELCAAAGIQKEPRIAVCGLNPHAGEDGLLGTEERDVIDPILDGLRGKHPGLSRALPGDTVFGRQLRGEFDVVIALYHDQGLAPLKTLEFDQSVNVTLGLPHVRTSPDHGTGFDIAGRGRADGTSFANAVRVAREISALRRLRLSNGR
jgi:4-hydroxythreonine-4-phosphate dehydrogenase